MSVKIIDFDHERMAWLTVGDEASTASRYIADGEAVSSAMVHVTVEPRDGKPFPLLCCGNDGRPLLDPAHMPERIVVEFPADPAAVGMFAVYHHRYAAYRRTTS
jgi:hypothetical protein